MDWKALLFMILIVAAVMWAIFHFTPARQFITGAAG